MGAVDVLRLLKTSGLSIALDGENLAVTPSAKITPDLRLLITGNKLALLSALAETETPWGWLLHFADRDPLEVYSHPPQTHAEILTDYPDAVAAQPIPEREICTTSCTTCTHSRKPGGVARYCSARPELPPAYGDGHPLRQLPEDGGLDCEHWKGR